MTDMIVSGAGTTAVNGTYTYAGIQSGKPYYIKGDVIINWYVDFVSFWVIGSVGLGTSYYSADNVATPDLCTTWYKGAGSLPAPTVTAAGGALLRVNMNAQMQSLTGGLHG